MNRDEILARIAADVLEVTDLEPVFADRLPVYALTVWQIGAALQAAFAAGQAAGRTDPDSESTTASTATSRSSNHPTTTSAAILLSSRTKNN